MKKNGFIFMVLVLTAGSQAGLQPYLPTVGPVALRFVSDAALQIVATLPDESTIPGTLGHGSRLDMIPEIPVESPTNDVSGAGSLMHDPPVLDSQFPLGPDGPMIGPMMETNNVITPQMLMRFFTPMLNGSSRETIVIPQTGFTPARPPVQSSTVNYSKPKP